MAYNIYYVTENTIQKGGGIMASVNWDKMTKQKIASSGMKAHMENDERKKREHSNTDIDKEKTDENYSIGSSSWHEAVKSLNTRNEAVDEILPPKRVRKDRVYGVSLEYICPRVLTEQGRSDEFFEKAHSFMESYFGAENVHGSFIHKDEVHDYIDKGGVLKTSCEHAHTLVSPYVDGKGINGNMFETRARLRDFNAKFNEMVLREFGIEYNTHETPGHKTVEELKKMETIERLNREIEDKTHTVEELEADIESYTKHYAKIKPKAFSKARDGYQSYNVTEVENLKHENERLRLIVEKTEMKQRYAQTGRKEYSEAALERYKLENEANALKREKAEFQTQKREFEMELNAREAQLIRKGFEQAFEMFEWYLRDRGLQQDFDNFFDKSTDDRDIADD